MSTKEPPFQGRQDSTKHAFEHGTNSSIPSPSPAELVYVNLQTKQVAGISSFPPDQATFRRAPDKLAGSTRWPFNMSIRRGRPTSRIDAIHRGVLRLKHLILMGSTVEGFSERLRSRGTAAEKVWPFDAVQRGRPPTPGRKAGPELFVCSSP